MLEPCTDTKLAYLEMLNDVTVTPSNVYKHKSLFDEIYLTDKSALAFSEGELIYVDGTEKISDFGAIVLKVVTVRELNGTTYEMDLLILSSSEKPKVITINSSELRTPLWIDNLGVQYMYEQNAVWKIRSAIKKMTKYAPNKIVYRYSGWAMDKANTYIMDGQELCHSVCGCRIHEKEECEFVLKMLDVAPRNITTPILSLNQLSLTHSEMQKTGEYAKFLLVLLGQTQSLKTSMAAAHCDFKRGQNAHTSFLSSFAAIVRIMETNRDCVTIIDDLKPPATSGIKREQEDKLEKIIRINSDNNNGYQRAGKRNTTVASKPNGLCIITAEELPIKACSSMARVLILEMNRKTVDKVRLSFIQANHAIYRRFLENYILYISEIGVEEYCNALKERFLSERNKFRDALSKKNIPIDPRTNDACTFLYIGFDEFLKYAYKVGAIDADGLAERHAESFEIYLKIAEDQAERINEYSEIRMFFKGLFSLLDTQEATITKLKAREIGYEAKDSREAIGFHKGEFIFLKKGDAFQQVASYYKRCGRDFPIEESTLRKQLHDNELLAVNSPKSLIYRLKVGTESYPCMKFHKKVFDRLKGEVRGGEEQEVSDNRGTYEGISRFV